MKSEDEKIWFDTGHKDAHSSTLCQKNLKSKAAFGSLLPTPKDAKTP